MRTMRGALILILALGFVACAGSVENPADLILKSGIVHTVDPDRPRAEAVAVRGSRILAVGSDEDMASLVGPDTRAQTDEYIEQVCSDYYDRLQDCDRGIEGCQADCEARVNTDSDFLAQIICVTGASCGLIDGCLDVPPTHDP